MSSQVSSDGRGLDLQSKGRGFEPTQSYMDLVQLASKSSECEGRPLMWHPESCAYMAALLYIPQGIENVLNNKFAKKTFYIERIEINMKLASIRRGSCPRLSFSLFEDLGRQVM